jgi:phosphonate transport system substrate-binding protein
MKRFFQAVTIALVMVGCLVNSNLFADPGKWQEEYPEITLGVITSENEADRVQRYKPVREYLEEELGVEVNWRSATDYAGIIEAMKAKKVELAYYGPASYSRAWLVTNGQVEPVLGELDSNGDFGYHSVVIVKTDSPYQSIEDLKGKKLAFADPNSTSGHQAPRYFLTEAGYDPDTFFGSTAFSGSHENSVIALLNDTFDAAATWWRSEERSNPQRMEEKGMIEPGQWRVIWTSPKLPSSPWAVPTWLPEQMRTDLADALYNMKDADPEAWQGLTDGKASGYKRVTHADYEAIVRMIKANMENRRQ